MSVEKKREKEKKPFDNFFAQPILTCASVIYVMLITRRCFVHYINSLPLFLSLLIALYHTRTYYIFPLSLSIFYPLFLRSILSIPFCLLADLLFISPLETSLFGTISSYIHIYNITFLYSTLYITAHNISIPSAWNIAVLRSGVW